MFRKLYRLYRLLRLGAPVTLIRIEVAGLARHLWGECDALS